MYILKNKSNDKLSIEYGFEPDKHVFFDLDSVLSYISKIKLEFPTWDHTNFEVHRLTVEFACDLAEYGIVSTTPTEEDKIILEDMVK